MSYLLDTNVISELVSPRPAPSVTNWIESLDPESVFLSVITIGELKRSIEKLSDSRRKKRLADWLTGDLLIRFSEHILAIDVPVILTWGALVARLEVKGKPMAAIDSLIAATAEKSGITLATRNVRHFGGDQRIPIQPLGAIGLRSSPLFNRSNYPINLSSNENGCGLWKEISSKLGCSGLMR